MATINNDLQTLLFLDVPPVLLVTEMEQHGMIVITVITKIPCNKSIIHIYLPRRPSSVMPTIHISAVKEVLKITFSIISSYSVYI